VRSRPSTDELWERFAREDAEFFILTEDDVDADRFFELGESDAARVLAVAEPWLRAFGTAVEIGCGVGRLAVPMAGHFERVVALDVSQTMLEKCRVNCEARGVRNVETLDAAAADFGMFDADLVFSHLVLQHIEDFAVIERYIALIRSWLGDGGVASLQFDTRPATVGYQLRGAVPDPLLPRAAGGESGASAAHANC
jgi:2-polyprenyl-3-methyl-5-hydroxy-6-metoxy-1,4-benzoquinol methylase